MIPYLKVRYRNRTQPVVPRQQCDLFNIALAFIAVFIKMRFNNLKGLSVFLEKKSLDDMDLTRQTKAFN